MPALIGSVLDQYCVVGQQVVEGKVVNVYNYTLPMCIFTSIAILALLVAFLLKVADRKYGYHLEERNIK